MFVVTKRAVKPDSFLTLYSHLLPMKKRKGNNDIGKRKKKLEPKRN